MAKEDDYAQEIKKTSVDPKDHAVQLLVSSPAGREYLWWLMQITKQDRSPFEGNALNTSFACGEHNIGLQIKAHLNTASPSGYIQMLQDQLNKTERE